MRTRIIVCSLIALIAIFTASCLPFDREYIIDHAFRDLLPELNFTYDVGDNTTPLLWRAVFAGLGQFIQIYANDILVTDFTCEDDAEFDRGLYSGGDIRLNGDLVFVAGDNITGISNINGVNIEDHHERHEFLGDDETNIRSQLIAQPIYIIGSHFNVNTAEILFGTGYTATSMLYMMQASGATSGGYSGRYLGNGSWFTHADAAFRNRCSFFVMTESDTDLMEAWIGWKENPGNIYTSTGNHYAIKYVSTVNGTSSDVYATNGNGTNNTSTLLMSGIGSWTGRFYYIEYEENDIKYYYSLNGTDWTLGATHTTNRPNGAAMFTAAYTKCAENVDKKVRVDNFKWMHGGLP